MNMDKASLREEKLKIRDSLTEPERKAFSEKIAYRLLASEEYEKAKAVLTYVSFRSEVSTYRIITESFELKKRVGVPRVNGNRMDFYEIRSLDELEKGYFGIPEPKYDPARRIFEPPEAMVIVPGACFDKELNRIGYGKGFYDRFFSENRNKEYLKCGICFEKQITNVIPADVYDRKLDMVITEERIIR